MNNKEKPSSIQHRLILRVIFIMAIVIVTNETLFRFSLISALRWIIQRPVLFFMNIAFLVGLTALLILLVKRTYGTIWFVGITALLIGILNANKAAIRSVPLVPQDFGLVRELWVLLPEFFSPLWIAMVIIALPVGYGTYLLLKRLIGKHHSLLIKRSMAMLLIASFLVLTVGQMLFTNDLDPWKTGIIYSLSNSTRRDPVMDSPDIEEGAESFLEEIEEGAVRRPSRKEPNVIVLMSEAFWDVNRLDVDFERNPVEFFLDLQQEGIHGDIYVPVFGGGTANTEFEVLTGLTLKNYPSDYHIVYREEIEERTDSLASIFSEQGYRSVAVHPYYSWYYQRDEVFRHLGFDEFISIENMEEGHEYGPFVSDEYVTDQIIEQMERTEEPLFLYSVTMQNHGPYNEEREEPWLDIDADMDESLKEILRVYSQGLYQSDRQLERLVEYLEESGDPTLLLFFGDHLPMMGNNYGVYREVEYIGDETQEELQNDLRLRTVPYVIWANYPIDSREMPLMNASYLAPMMLENAGRSLPGHMQGIKGLHERMPFFKRSYGVTEEGVVHDHLSEEYQEIITIYRKINERVVNQSWELD